MDSLTVGVGMGALGLILLVVGILQEVRRGGR